MLNIDEAIARERELAEMHRNNIVPKENYRNMPWIDKNNEASMRNAEEHEQLAEWLEELKFLRQWKPDVMDEFCKFDCNSVEEVRHNAHNKAVDDFAEKLLSAFDETNIKEYGFYPENLIMQVAKQLKAGGENG